MNKFCKAAAAISGGLIALGLILTITGLMMGGSYRELNQYYNPDFIPGPDKEFRIGPFQSWGWEQASSVSGEESRSGSQFSQTYTDITSLEVLCTMAEVRIRPGDTFRVEAVRLDRFSFGCQAEDGRLTVSCYPLEEKENFYLDDDRRPLVTITLPRDFEAEEVHLEVEMGSLEGEGLHTRTAHLKAEMGELELDSFFCAGGTVESSMGSVDLSGRMTGQYTVACDGGKVELDVAGRPEEYDYQVSVEMGKVSLPGWQSEGMENSFSRQTGAANSFDVTCGMGTVEIEIEP